MATQRDTKATDDLEKQIAQLQADVADLTKTLGAVAKQKAAEAGARGREALADAGDHLRRVESEAVDYVRTKPIQALAIAAGLGLLVGYLTRNR